VDPWDTPYAYFASNGVNYDARVQFPWVATGGNQQFAWPAGAPLSTPVSLEVAANTAYTYAIGANPFGGEPSYAAHPYGTGAGAGPVTPITWTNPNRFQIISAGPDQGFGAGSYIATTSPAVAWQPWANGRNEYISGGTGNVGYDDIANFNGGAQLGEPGTN
jgi:hypothetical protein